MSTGGDSPSAAAPSDRVRRLPRPRPPLRRRVAAQAGGGEVRRSGAREERDRHPGGGPGPAAAVRPAPGAGSRRRPETSPALFELLGKEPQFVDGLRVTDEETVGVVEMVLAGQASTSGLVSMIHRARRSRRPDSPGKDGMLVEARPHPSLRRARLRGRGRAHRHRASSSSLVEGELHTGRVLRIGFGADGGHATTSTPTPSRLVSGRRPQSAEKLIVLTDVPKGIHQPTDNGHERIATLDLPAECGGADGETGVVSRGMVPKLRGVRTAPWRRAWPSSHIIAASRAARRAGGAVHRVRCRAP